EPPVCRVAATPYPAITWHWTQHYTAAVGQRERSASGHGPSQGAACMPGGGYALPGLQTALDPPLHWIRRPAQA
ncbi:hypothetical protein, partial [Klebsiella pneumoniae]|uniref:hypothetical protein n=1 Tax=Klebsiella pneumoniae TaxID=573 RepID=UPI0021F6CFFF